jgi:uncharacterized phage protein (TIGR02216 family)
MMQRFPWDAVMRLGIGTYHIPPREFWLCTLREIVLTRGDDGLKRGRLIELMKLWPD